MGQTRAYVIDNCMRINGPDELNQKMRNVMRDAWLSAHAVGVK